MQDSKINYDQQIATVRNDLKLCDQEVVFTQARAQAVLKSLQAALGLELTASQMPRIALCASGGGIRATLATLGALQGSTIPGTSLNIMDLSTHFTALSGSTWALAGLEFFSMQPNTFLKAIAPNMALGLLDDFNMIDLATELKTYESYGQPVSFVNIYGMLIAQRLFKNITSNPSSIDVMTLAQKIDPAKSPLAIQTCVIDNDSMSEYHWLEFTPFEVGSAYLKSFIPLWAFGRKFANGKSIDFAPPVSLGYCIGIWSSAMCIDAKDFFDIIVQQKMGDTFKSHLQEQFGNKFTQYLNDQASKLIHSGSNFIRALGLENLLLGGKSENEIAAARNRFSPAKVSNWTQGDPSSPIKNDINLTLIDAGIDINIPMSPLLRPEREIDIIIVFDASDNIREFKKAQEYAKNHNYAYPPIDYSKTNQTVSVHKGPHNDQAPIVIYLPLIKNAGYKEEWDPFAHAFTQVFNNQYTQEEIDLLTGLMKYNMEQSMPVIRDTIKQWIENKKLKNS